MLKTLVFDLDNTLFDTDVQIYHSMFHEISKELSQRKIIAADPDSIYLKMVNLSASKNKEELLEALVNGYGLDFQKKDLEFAFTTFDKFRPSEIYLYPGAWTTLEILKKKYKLILLSEGEKDFQGWKIDKLKIRDFFAELYIVTKNGKRDVLKNLKNPESVAVIGDRINYELTIAKELGMIPIAFSHGRHNTKVGGDWYYRVKSMTQLPEILAQIERK